MPEAAAYCHPMPDYHVVAARIRFGRPPSIGRDECERAAQELLGALCRNGQIGTSWVNVFGKTRAESYVSLPRPSALNPRFMSPWGRKSFQGAKSAFGRAPAFELIETPERIRYPDWRRADLLVMGTDMLQEHSPLWVVGNDEPIPLYLLPIPHQERGYICDWANQYRALDSLWIGSGALEMVAYRELAEPGSDLSTTGRAICMTIERAIRKPVYYRLTRQFGRSERLEKQRLCPGCGRPWFRSEGADEWPERSIGFLCAPCRLVSNDWGWGQGGRHARIGEWKGKSGRP